MRRSGQVHRHADARSRCHQNGSGLPAALLLTVLLAAAGVLARGELAEAARMRAQARSIDALARAREALIGYAVSYAERHPGTAPGYLPCPDNRNTGSTPIGACGARDIGSFGRLPYRTLGLADLRDGWGNCLWYAVAGSIKNNPKPRALNWDSPGQFLPRTADGTRLSTDEDRIVAVVLASGPPLPGQQRTVSADRHCPGSDAVGTDIEHFLDETYPLGFDAGLEVVQGRSDDLARNDLIVWIGTADIFDALRRRADFVPYLNAMISTAASALATRLDEAAFIDAWTLPTGDLKIGPLPSAVALGLPTAQRSAHDNWRDQFQFAVCVDGSACISVARDDNTVDICHAVLLFGGERTARQRRASAAERADPTQYFEGDNALHLHVGTPTFAGSHRFAIPTAGTAASTDVIQCLE